MQPGCVACRRVAIPAMSNGSLASITTSRASTTFSAAPASMSASTADTFASHVEASVSCVMVKVAGAPVAEATRDPLRAVAGSMIVRHVRPSAACSTIRAGMIIRPPPAKGSAPIARAPTGRPVPSPHVSCSCAIERRVATALGGSTTAAIPAVTKQLGPSSHAVPSGPRCSNRSQMSAMSSVRATRPERAGARRVSEGVTSESR